MVFGKGRSRDIFFCMVLLMVLSPGMLWGTGLREEPPERPGPPLQEPLRALPSSVVRVALVPGGGDEASLEKGVRQALEDQNRTLAGRERLVLFQKDSPPPGALDLQINLVERAVAGGAHVILLDALDSRGLVAAAERARAAGVLVVTLMHPLEEGGADFHVGTDTAAASGSVVEHLFLYGGAGPVALLPGEERPRSFPGRARQVLRYLDENYPEVRILKASPPGPISREAAAVAARGLVAAVPDLAAIVATDGASLEGAARGVLEAGGAGRVAVIGFDKTPETVAFLEEGVIRGILVEDPLAIGYVAMVRAVAALRGEDVPKEIFVPYRLVGP
ncbi:ABC-type sugar transport system, substrate-binding protein, contains N-terminal xre family HTH domain [Alkalispirochaeta americana]|uniref:ABC-type sugar transport system, substrate-binding protein, contains N-terminal xre family HTH domain n=1 Tax=Alkalispirochaeta americana TaxID=159291 RepID=A0A1N6NEW1_9SPIO|nr:substrate-binding domain-containing protein [Alkalispirochaeta americana]SIP90619.1 ABC-type sugar transport system, substrate-binding protein, contains N-terminal xre family HTH domain [Alkalispirochaeta americana]